MFEVVLSGAAKVKFFQNGKVQSEHITIYHNISQCCRMGVDPRKWVTQAVGLFMYQEFQTMISMISLKARALLSKADS